MGTSKRKANLNNEEKSEITFSLRCSLTILDRTIVAEKQHKEISD